MLPFPPSVAEECGGARREEAAERGADLGACSGADAAHLAQEEEAQQSGLRLRPAQRRVSPPLPRRAVRRNKGIPVGLAPQHVCVLGVALAPWGKVRGRGGEEVNMDEAS